MKLLMLVFCSLVTLSSLFADPIVSVTSSCAYSTCTGGVQPGSVFESGIQSLDVYTSATIDAVFVPPPTIGQVWDPFSVAVDVTLQTYGSGTGALVVDPLYTVSYSQGDSEETKTSIIVDANNSADPQLTCAGLPTGASIGNSPICSGEAVIPIVLGSQVHLLVTESNDPSVALPATSTVSADFTLWTDDLAGDASPVILAAAAPEPAWLCILGFGLLAGLVLSRRRRLG